MIFVWLRRDRMWILSIWTDASRHIMCGQMVTRDSFPFVCTRDKGCVCSRISKDYWTFSTNDGGMFFVCPLISQDRNFERSRECPKMNLACACSVGLFVSCQISHKSVLVVYTNCKKYFGVRLESLFVDKGHFLEYYMIWNVMNCMNLFWVSSWGMQMTLRVFMRNEQLSRVCWWEMKSCLECIHMIRRSPCVCTWVGRNIFWVCQCDTQITLRVSVGHIHSK